MNENETFQGDEISLFDLWEKLCEGWKSVVGGLVLGIAGAVAGIVLTPSKYEASVTLQVGKVAGSIIEAPEILAQRVRLPAFLVAVAEADGDVQWLQSLQANAFSDKIVTSSIIKGTQLVSIVVTGNTRDQSQKRATLLLDRLKASHEELRMPLIRKLQRDMEVAQEKLKTAELEFSEILKVGAGNAAIKDLQFAPVSLLTSLRVQKQAEIFSLRQQLITGENSLLPPNTEPTRPVEAIFAPQNPVSPKKPLLLALGTIGGLLAGIFFIIGRDAWRSASNKRIFQQLSS